jgi:signal transduction histidine kinase
MRLADFIVSNTHQILTEWDVFAREIWPQAAASQRSLRDHAEEILRAAARDMQSPQTTAEQQDKSQGQGKADAPSDVLDSASIVHARGRVDSGFSLPAMVAEYRALRASVVRLWSQSGHSPDARDLVDLTRFNETIDQSLTEAVRGYTEQVDQARQMFLAILGHDLRNPLNAIVVSADLVKESRPATPEATEAAAQIVASSQAMARMLGDFLDFAHTQLGKRMPIKRGAAHLGRLCSDVVTETRAAHPDQQIHYSATGDVTGDWDAPRLRQVISNLLGNAVQHGTAGTPIELTLRNEGDDVAFSLTNEGAAIPAELVPRIFHPMIRGVSPESRAAQRPGSMGLGLYIAREVVTSHGGTIDVVSSASGITTFTVRLPRRPVSQE